MHRPEGHQEDPRVAQLRTRAATGITGVSDASPPHTLHQSVGVSETPSVQTGAPAGTTSCCFPLTCCCNTVYDTQYTNTRLGWGGGGEVVCFYETPISRRMQPVQIDFR